MSTFPYDPRLKKEPLGTKTAARRLLEDILTENIVKALAKGTASNYFTSTYGSNHRVFYEGVSQLLAEVLVDSVDNIDDSELSQLRAEFLSTRLLYSIFPPNEESVPTTDTIEELHTLLNEVLKSLFSGSTYDTITNTLNNTANQGDVLLELSNNIASITSSLLSLTGVSDGHQHFAVCRSTGLGSTSYPIGLKWGDNLHTHLIIDGVVQPYTDSEGNSHTHEISLGLSPDVVRLQENLRKIFAVLKPAHIKTGGVSSVVEETIDAPSDEFSLSLGEFFQEDMRKVRLGNWDDIIFGYASNKTLRVWRTNIVQANNLLIKSSETAPTGQRRRVLSVTSSVPSDGEYTTWSFPLDTLAEEFNRSTGIDTLVVENGFVYAKNSGTGFTQLVPLLGDGSLVLLNQTAFYLENFLVSPIKQKLTAQVIQLDSYSENQGVVEITNLSCLWKVRHDIRYEQYTFTFYPSPSDTYFDFPLLNTRAFYKGVALNITTSCTILVNGSALPEDAVVFYSPFENRLYVLGASAPYLQAEDRVTIVYPYDEDEVYTFKSLNNKGLVLNATRHLRQVQTTTGRKAPYLAPATPPYHIRRKNFVLNKAQLVSPYVTETREVSYGVSSSSTSNTLTKKLNSTFVLNKISPSSSVSKQQITAPAISTLTTTDGHISFVQLGFKPDYILSITDSEGAEYTGTLANGYLDVGGITTSTELTISALSTTPFTDNGSWYSGDKVLEGQALLKKSLHTSLLTDSSADEIMENPLGLAVPQVGGGYADATRSVIARSTSTYSGTKGEPLFYEDRFTDIGVSGYHDHLHMETDVHDGLAYEDYSLYTLGPISTTELTTLTTIPTYLFFHYSFLSLFGGDGYYFSIYRIDPLTGTKYYQTLNPQADGLGFFAFEEHPAPPNGAPLAYRWLDEGGGGGFTLGYNNGVFPTFTAEPNGSFNHIPYQTYYIEVYMEQNGGADELFFFSSGTNAPYDLNTSWISSSEVYALDDPMGMGFGVTYTIAVTFATNPGEVTSWNYVADPAPLALKEAEDVGKYAEVLADIISPSEPLYGDRLSFVVDSIGGLFTPPQSSTQDDVVPVILDSVDFVSSRSILEYVPSLSDSLATSYLLLPSSITETTQLITDSYNYTYRISLGDTITLGQDDAGSLTRSILQDSFSVIDSVDQLLRINLSPVDLVGAVLDSTSVVLSGSVSVGDSVVLGDQASGSLSLINLDFLNAINDGVSFHQTRTLSDTLIGITDEILFRLSGVDEVDSVPSISDVLSVNYNYLPNTYTDVVGGILDSLLVKRGYGVSDSVVGVVDEVLARIASYSALDLVTLSDNVAFAFSYVNPVVTEAVPVVTDEVSTYTPMLDLSDGVSVSDSVLVGNSVAYSTSDSLSVFDAVVTSYSYAALSLTDSISLSDETAQTYGVSPADLYPSLADEVSFHVTASLSVADDVGFSDTTSTSYVYGNVNISESVGSIVDSISTSYLYAAYNLTDNLSVVDSVIAQIKSMNISDSVSVGDSSTAFIASINQSDVVSIADSAGIRVPLIETSDDVSAISDTSSIQIVSYGVSDSVSVGDATTASVSITADFDDLMVVSDTVVASLAYSVVEVSDLVTSQDDVLVNRYPTLVLSDGVSATLDDLTTSHTFIPVNNSDSVSLLDSVVTSYLLLPSNISESVASVIDTTTQNLFIQSNQSDSLPAISDDWSAYVKSKFVGDSVSVSDDVLTTFDEYLSLVDGSISFAGTDTSYLVAPDISAYDTGTYAFRVEWWMYLDSSGAGTNPIIFSRNLRVTADRFRVQLQNKTTFVLSVSTGSALVSNSFGSVETDTWVHLAIIGNSSNIRVFKNGVQLGSTWATAFNLTNSISAPIYFGNETTPVSDTAFKGYLSNFRYLYQFSGARELTTNTATFSVPISPLPDVTATVLLLRATTEATATSDSSSYANTLTNTSSVSWSNFVPRIANPMSGLSLGGVFSLPYNNGYLSRTGDSDLNLSSGDFTIEWFQYLTNTQVSTTYNHTAYVFDLDYPGASKQLSVYFDAGTNLIYLAHRVNASTNYSISFSVSYIRERWNHFALTRYNGYFYLTQNGYSLHATKVTDSYSLNVTTDYTGASNGSLFVGSNKTQTANTFFNGYLSNIKVSVGIARYTSANAPFTPPTSVLSTDVYTKLLLLADTEADLLVDSSGLSNTMSSSAVEWEDFSTAFNDLMLSAAVQYSSTLYNTSHFFIYSTNDYYTEQAQGNTDYPSLVASTPLVKELPTTALSYGANYRAAFSPALGAGYTNANTNADLTFKVLSNSNRPNVVEVYEASRFTEYKIFSRINNDASPSPELNIAFKVGSSWGSYYNLFPSSGGTNVRRNYLHTLRVNSDGTTTFTQDTTGQTALYPIATSVRLYCYFKNLDYGAGGSASPQSTIQLKTSALNLVSPLVKVSAEYTGATGLVALSNITNGDNVSQMSWTLSTGSVYRLYLDKDADVDLIVGFRAYTYTANGDHYNTLYDANNPPDYRSFSNDIRQQNLYLQVLEDGTVLITQP